MEVSFLDLKEKEIVNVYDGKKLGRITDVVLDISSGKFLGIIAPGDKKIFRKCDDVYIPLEKIKRIGGDVILVGLQNNSYLNKTKNNYLSNNLRSFENYYDDTENKVAMCESKTKNTKCGSYIRYKPLNIKNNS